MKKVLITGAGSYIGTAFENWIKENAVDLETDTVDLKNDLWRQKNFARYDVIFHVAGIAHAEVGKATEEQKQLYYKVNAQLAAECAQKAKLEGVGQFIFMSSIIVYGESGGIGEQKVITKDTPPAPSNFYGDSKRKAEEVLLKLDDDDFRVVVLRPPMIYGRGSRGNYPLLAKMAVRLPLFPREENRRSMLYIGNLCKFVELMIRNGERGIFFPQNADYVCTSDMAAAVAAAHGKKIHMTRLFHPFLLLLEKIGGKPGGLVNKAFGNIVYEQAMSEYREEYRMYGFEESIRLTER